MHKETIIKLARESGAVFDRMPWAEQDQVAVFERLSKLVAEHEREACAKYLDGLNTAMTDKLAAEIRARGSK